MIEDSEFLSSSFCKGLIYYSRFKTISYTEIPIFLNYTSNFQGTVREANPEDESEKAIKIKNSDFQNIGFQQVTGALSLVQYGGTKKNTYETFLSNSNLEFDRFFDPALILHTHGFEGAI